MELFEHVVHMGGRSDVAYLIPIGDIHYGSKNCDLNKLQATIDWIKANKYAYVITMGDMCEYIVTQDKKRFDPSNIDRDCINHLTDLPRYQANKIISLLRPIENRIIGMLRGNHEEAIRIHHSQDIHAHMVVNLNTKDLGYSCMGRISFRRQFSTSRPNGSGRCVKIWAHHGHGGGRTKGGNLNRIGRVARDFDADIYLMGHVHDKDPGMSEYLKLSDSGEPRLFAHKRVFALTGTFFKTYEVGTCSYSEKAMYPPTTTGVVKIRIEPFVKHKINGNAVDLPPHLHVSV